MKTIYHNAVVYTGTLPLSDGFIVEDGRFTYVGADVLAQSRPGDEVIDLGGAFVCPGFNDSHMHLLNYGQTLTVAPLHENTGSLAALKQCLSDFIASGVPLRGGWVMGRGWNQDYFSDCARMPNRWDLDEVSTELPICAVRACGHALVVNSRVLELIGITADTPQPAGGQIVMERGVPNGIFFDNAMDLIYDAIPAPSRGELKNMILSACHALNAYGITSSQTDDYCVFRGVSWQQVDEVYRELERSGELTVRVCQQANFTSLDNLKEFVEAGNTTGTGTALYQVGPLKILGDGALGARTAFLSRPYADEPSTRGFSVFKQETFDEMIGYAHEQGMPMAIHTIGDACLDMVLCSIEKVLRAYPRADHRHGVVHCQITRPDQLEKLARLGLHVYAQTIFLDYDSKIVEARVGPELAQSSYNWKTLMRKGVTVSNGTDCPVEKPDALAGIQCAITRKPLKGGKPYLPRESFTMQEALDSYTCAGARASREEMVKGKIAPGMMADFVVLGKNPFTADENAIKDIPVLATWLGGRKVYGK